MRLTPGSATGDHGVTIGKIAGLIEKSLDGWDDDDVENISGGPGGQYHGDRRRQRRSIYGTMIGGLSGPLEGINPLMQGL